MANIAVIGAGGWGTALARLLFFNGHNVLIWSVDEQQVKEMRELGENRHFLPDILLPPEIELSSDRRDLATAEVVVFAVPSHAIAEVAHDFAAILRQDALLISVAKGFVPHPLRRISQVLAQELPGRRIVVLSGPSHAEEVARDLPTVVCVSSEDEFAMLQAQQLFSNRNFRVYTNSDVVGVEVAGAVKNVVALMSGVLAGLGLGDNTRAALMTRGLAEMIRLGVALGADPATFSGLAGVGDLIVTCTSMHSRNFRAGRAIGRGKPWPQVLKEMGMVVEGVYATEYTYELAQKLGVSMPLTEQMYRILYQDHDPHTAMEELMNRASTQEWA